MDFPATSYADTLYHTGKAPTFEDREHCQKLNYVVSDAEEKGSLKDRKS